MPGQPDHRDGVGQRGGGVHGVQRGAPGGVLVEPERGGIEGEAGGGNGRLEEEVRRERTTGINSACKTCCGSLRFARRFARRRL